MDIIVAINTITSDYSNLRGKITNSDVLRILGVTMGLNDSNTNIQLGLLNNYYMKVNELRGIQGGTSEYTIKRVELANIYIEIMPEIRGILKIYMSNDEIDELLGGT